MSDEPLTVAEAAQRLGLTIPRLRRWLARPENASFSFSMPRQTRTGTRTAVVIPVSVLGQIKKHIEQEREQKQEKTAALPVSGSASYMEALLQEKDARIAELTEALKTNGNAAVNRSGSAGLIVPARKYMKKRK